MDKAKKRLGNYKYIKREIKELQECLILIDESSGVGGIDYGGAGGGKNNISNIVENVALSNLKEKAYLLKEISRREKQIEGIEGFLRALNSKDRVIVVSRLMCDRQWYQVSREVGLSQRQCQRRANKALGIYKREYFE